MGSRPTAIDRIRATCMALPEVEERSFGGHTAPAFRVRDKLFVMTSEDGTTMTCKVPPGENTLLVADEPERYFMPKYVGSKGWVGVRIADLDDGDAEEQELWQELTDLMVGSYRLIAPKRLAALVG
ncbi:MAG TPA: MmcQ/YjbR family DNA-binding protein [Acidimicrobiales bacterium]|nr:MmcQ/YjbR family DNA-binding protein [Acidimicrobiales bacterium]